MNTEQEILDYMYSKEVNGALLLTGRWGCGKTYTINRVIETVNRRNAHEKCRIILIMVSLFGVDSLDKLENKLSMNLVYSYASIFEDSDNKMSSVIKAVKGWFQRHENAALEQMGSYIKLNPLDFIKISNRSVPDGKKESSKREYVIVLDDFERCRIDSIELLGKVNEYVETEKVKTIIIADENKIDDDKYREFKEKVIERTVHLMPDYNSAIEEIIVDYQETETGYRGFLHAHIGTIVAFFKNSKSENLRILKTILIDFERVYRAIGLLNLPEGVMDKVLFDYGSKVYRQKRPLEKDSMEKKKQEIDFEKEEISIPTEAIDQWISDGIWDEELLQYEYRDRFFQENNSNDQVVLHAAFWTLNDTIIREGLPVAIQKAYKGDLSSEDIICLVELLYYLQKTECTMPCYVDYSRIDSALDERIRKIKAGEMQEPTNRRFIDDVVVRMMDRQAQDIYKKAYGFNKCLVEWNNRQRFIHVMDSKLASRINALRSLAYEEFDVEMMEKFFAWYSIAENGIKRSLAAMLCHTFFRDHSTEKKGRESTSTFKTMNMLKRRIEDLEKAEGDSITKWIHRNFLRELEQLLAQE